MYKKKFSAELDSLYAMLEFINAYGEEHSISTEALGKIQLAAEEALVNIISYGYPDEKKGTIEILCISTSSKPGIKITIKDQGIAFDPIKKAPREVPSAAKLIEDESAQLGGYGIYILIGLTDKVEYKRLKSGNKLILTKYS